jgi:hypothetical protein
MIVVLFGIAAMAVSVPLIAALLVSVASRREDANWTLGAPPASWLEAAARRIVAFNADSVEWPRSKARQQAEALRRELALQAVGTAAQAGTRNSS